MVEILNESEIRSIKDHMDKERIGWARNHKPQRKQMKGG